MHQPHRAVLGRIHNAPSSDGVTLSGPTQKCFHNLVLLTRREQLGIEPASEHGIKSIVGELGEIFPVPAVLVIFDLRRLKMVVVVVAYHLGELALKFVVAKLLHIDGEVAGLVVTILGHDTGARCSAAALRLC